MEQKKEVEENLQHTLERVLKIQHSFPPKHPPRPPANPTNQFQNHGRTVQSLPEISRGTEFRLQQTRETPQTAHFQWHCPQSRK